MNTRTLCWSFALLSAGLALPALAHDPKEHEKEAAAAKAGPNCAKLQTMDLSKMDPNDSVIKAMHLRCDKVNAASDEHHDDGHDHSHHDEKAPAPADQHGGH